MLEGRIKIENWLAFILKWLKEGILMSKHIKDGRAFLFLQKFCKLYMEEYNKFAIIESEYAHDAEIQLDRKFLLHSRNS